MSSSKGNSISQLIERHRALDLAIRNRRASFVSDWNCSHPFVKEFLGPSLASMGSEAGEYVYLDERPAITGAVLNFHRKTESLDLCAANVLAGSGSSSLLVAFAFWLVRRGVRRVYYVPPLYHTLHYFLTLLNIIAIPVSSKQAFEPNFNMTLPEDSSILLFCDPIWYAGKQVPAETIGAISSWQERTNSLVFIDGSFQYLHWDANASERTSTLNMERTFRLVCPTKALAVHSFRFSYLLHPSQFHNDLTFLYESLVGSVAAGNLAFGLRALDVLASEKGNRPLRDFLQNTFQDLVKLGFLRTEVAPDCGYYVFGIPTMPVNDQVAMGGNYFELTGYPDYVRINLMVAHRICLG